MTNDTRLVDDLNFHIGAKAYKFLPLRAAPHELPHLLLLLAACTAVRSVGALDTEEFVNRHQLWHCFLER